MTKRWIALVTLALLFLSVLAQPVAPENAVPLPVVCLDPGHGAADPGATNGDLQEKEINLDVAYKVKELLEADGYSVVMTRSDDSNPTNEERFTTANSAGASVLVSIHTNSVLNNADTADGSMALYFKKDDMALAQTMREVLYADLRGTAEGAGIVFRDFGLEKFAARILMSSNMPATIAEPVCMSHPQEATWLSTQLFLDPGKVANPDCVDCRRAEIAESIHGAIVLYLEQGAPGDDNVGGRPCDNPPCGK
jgi:N-acetylmuramoyl-L-alanine amidase